MPASRAGLAVATLVAGIALLVPPLLAVGPTRVLANDWFVRFEYRRDGFPADPYGMTRAERTRLALIGLRSILPSEREGIGLLRQARLRDGRPAFRDKELRHMGDVRRIVGVLFPLQPALLGILAALAAVGGRCRRALVRGLQLGAALTLAVAAVTAILVALDAVAFLDGFHTLFFEGESWRFAETDTLRRLFPDRFWSDTAVLLGAGAAGQAAVVLGAATLWLRRQA